MCKIYFDGVCNLCNGLVSFLIKRDKKKIFKFASLQSEPGQEVLKQLDLDKGVYKTIIYHKGNKYYFKSSAILHVLKDLGGAWKLTFAFILIPPIVRDLLYTAISKTRYRFFGKQKSCMVPSPDIVERFLI